MKNKDTKNQSSQKIGQQDKKLSTPSTDVDSGETTGNSWDHSADSAGKTGSTTGRQDRRNVDIETDDGYQDSRKRNFSSSDSESVEGEGYSSPSGVESEDQSFSEDESDMSSEQRRSSSLDKDEEEEQ